MSSGNWGFGKASAASRRPPTVTIVTNNVLLFNVSAPSASDAMARVTALATEFLKYRAQYDLAVQQQEVSELNQQFSQAQTSLDSINAQITQISAKSSSPAVQAELAKLETQRNAQGEIEQYVTDTKATLQTSYLGDGARQQDARGPHSDPALALEGRGALRRRRAFWRPRRRRSHHHYHGACVGPAASS